MSTHRVVVIGAGMGGLVSALQLAAQGLEVTVVEAAAGPGGKVRQIEVDGAAIDSGPTVMTMRWVFDQILGAVGAHLDTELKLRPLSVLARHWWDDGSSLDLHADAAGRQLARHLRAPATGKHRLPRFGQQLFIALINHRNTRNGKQKRISLNKSLDTACR